MAAANTDSNGTQDGIHFQSDITWRHYNLFKIWFLIKGFIRSVGYLKKHDLDAIILFLGRIPNNEVSKILKRLMTIPNEYISGGFLTKLGKYMFSGTPMLVN